MWDSLGEGDLEDHIQITKVVGLLVEGQALVLDSLDVLWLDNLAWLVLDPDFAAVKMGHHEVHASQCLVQGDLLLHEDVGALALEGLVRLLLHDDDHVAWLDTRVLVALTVECVGLTIWRTFVNFDINDLLLLLHAVFSTYGLALLIFLDAVTVDSDLGLLAVIDVLERHLQRVLEGLHLLGHLLLTPTTSTEQVKEVHPLMHASGAALLEALLTVGIVNVTLLFVSEDLVGLLELLELLGVATTVRMVLQSQLLEGLVDILHCGFLVDAEQVVVLAVVHILGGWGSAHARRHATEWESLGAAATSRATL